MTSETSPDPHAGDTVKFIAMADGDQQDYALLDRLEREHASGLANRLMDTLGRLEGSLGGYQITRLEHSLQSATRARRSGADTDWVVAALLHDIGDELAPYNHSQFAASILQPYVREEVTWVIKMHGLFQSYYYAHFSGNDRNERDQYAEHPWYQLCLEFCAEWDQNCFDPTFPNHPLESFRPLVEEVFARKEFDPDVLRAGPARLY